ncbi:hypothetical protein DAEQUDRAFT_673865 [Daedalea quercina L-15889]|uniref:Methyltransferase domain-containing protein n=1 Tax=Daedalea quercina L-15889 TaxID=1314783 RepID=A0A165NKK8_9APHY|nr:hypothetical protein DAEQUDRAFT_673865 [Daedalea quercina L-15889]
MSADIHAFLSSPHVVSLLSRHPNRFSSSTAFYVPPEWASWWAWAGESQGLPSSTAGRHTDSHGVSEPTWLLILRYYARVREREQDSAWLLIPDDARSLVDAARRMQVSRVLDEPVLYLGTADGFAHRRAPSPVSSSEDRILGMSPKKAHEIIRMSAYISKLLSSSPVLADVKHVVDIGAGQAYLSRAIRDELGLHVLALDWSDVQSKGAARRETIGHKKRKKVPDDLTTGAAIGDVGEVIGVRKGSQTSEDGSKGSLTYKTLEIRSDSLLRAVDEWAEEMRANQESGSTSGESLPTLFVALHACGSLTLNLLRAFISRLQGNGAKRRWAPCAAVIVGCCYNLLEAGDFPLSRKVIELSRQPSAMHLTPNHLHLAAQTPGQWLRTKETLEAAKLAIRKVVWRALLQNILEKHDSWSVPIVPSNVDTYLDKTAIINGETPSLRRLGRLNDSAYSDWGTFVRRAQERLGVRLDPALCEKDAAMESRLEVFQALRCILGPVIESLILLDREEWLRDELKDTSMNVRLVNLFDQASGSARNIAIVITPQARSIG